MSNPILSFSARRRMRTVRTPVILTLYMLALGLTSYFAVYAPFMGDTVSLGSMRASVYGYAILVILQFGLLILVAPAMTAGSISGERERQTLDLLLVTNTSAFRIVVAKLLESFGFLALMILSSMPMLSLVLLTGGATVMQVLMSVAFLLVTALAALSVGLFCSSLFKRTVASTVASYLAIFAIGIVTLLPLAYDIKRIGDLYDAMNIVGQQLHMIDITPVSFTLNPGLGLFSLLQDQTQLIGGTSDLLGRFSYTLANTVEYLPFDHFLAANMLFMGCASVILTAFSALRLRTRHERKPKGTKKA